MINQGLNVMRHCNNAILTGIIRVPPIKSCPDLPVAGHDDGGGGGVRRPLAYDLADGAVVRLECHRRPGPGRRAPALLAHRYTKYPVDDAASTGTLCGG